MRTTKPFLIAGIPIAGFAALSYQSGYATAWAPPSSLSSSLPIRQPLTSHSSPSTTALQSTSSTDLESLHLTPELTMMTNAFASIPDEKTRHKQLLYMASKLPDVGDEVRVKENKVPGCLSTVFVDCVLEKNDEDGEYVVNYFGDSDGLLTKGLLALLIRGLSGCTPQQINEVDAQFIQAAKISQTLTPGRNNGFLNMLAVMKRKALEKEGELIGSGDDEVNGKSDDAVEEREQDATTSTATTTEQEIVTTFTPIDNKPMYNTILTTLITVLKPTSITLTDNSDQHAGHAGSKGFQGESHFALEVTAEAFEGLSLVKRHKLIYMLLGEVMQKIHALEIKAKSPSEV
eukprot:scaffold13581_cov222-Alexandrium_tamarense.AAC.3